MKALERIREHPLLVTVAVLALVYLLFRDNLPEIDVETALEDLGQRLGDWTYLLVSVLAFLETGAFVGLVFPGETAVVVAGAIAGNGETSIVITIGLVWFSAWMGDSASFYIGHRLGRGFILRHGHRVRITQERFAQVEDYFQRHGGKTILVGRFLGLVRALAPFIAGSSGMRYRAFLPYSVLGTGLWAATFSLLGYFLANSLDRAGDIAGRGTLLFGTIVALTVMTVVTVRFLRVPENRARLVASLERHRAGRPLVALGHRLRPHARFVWARLTPGGLGLEFTSVVAVLSVALFIVVGYGEILDDDLGPTPGDETAANIAEDLRAGWLTEVNQAVTALGSSLVTIGVALVGAALLAARRHWLEVAVLAGWLVIVHVGVDGLKELLDRPRPPDPLVGVRGDSWPSGHAAFAIIYPWLAVTATVRLRPGRAHATAWIVAGIVLAAAVGLSRVYLGAHHLSDVNSGAAFGVAVFAALGAIALAATHLRENSRE